MVDDETPTTTPSEKNGVDVEKWILRILLAGAVDEAVRAVQDLVGQPMAAVPSHGRSR